MKKTGKGKSAGGPRKSRRKSAFKRWLDDIERLYGARPDRSGRDKNFQLIIPYSSNQLKPQVFPRPRGPSMGAALTVKQMVNTFGTSTLVNNGSATQPPGIQQAGATAVNFQMSFQLSDLAQVSTLSSLFDQYKFEKVCVRFTPDNNALALNAATAPNRAPPDLYVCVDRDDANTLTGITDIVQYDNVQCVGPTGAIDVIIKPSVTRAVFTGGLFSGYSVEEGDDVWIDIANTTVPYYGIKGVISALNATSSYTYGWHIEAWYEVSFKNTR